MTDVAALAELSNEAFADYVEERLDPAGPGGDWEKLLAPELVDRTGQALADLRRDLDETCGEIRKEATRNQFAAWRRDVYRPTLDLLTLRRTSVVDRKRRYHLERQERQKTEARTLVARLATGIQRHRLACVASGFDPEQHDRDLWALLSRLSIDCYGGSLTLDEAIGREVWKFDDTSAEGRVSA
jgi:hypothetical protein